MEMEKKSKDSLGDRMKRYERVVRTYVTPRTPVVIRIDGKSFHTYTRGLGPFDKNVSMAMVKSAHALCNQIQGAQMAYTQSDEISVLVHTYKRFELSPWFDGQIQKMTSVAASIAAATFTMNSDRIFGKIKPAYFDARVLVLPEAEVCNYFIWRQQDCIRNSVQSIARSVFSHKKCDRKDQDELKQMLRDASAVHGLGVLWENLADKWRNGMIVERKLTSPRVEGHVGNRYEWIARAAYVPFVEHRAQVEDYLATEEPPADMDELEHGKGG